MSDKDQHHHRVSGISGRTTGKMHRKSKAKPSSERRGLRSRNQMRPPFDDAKRYPSGKFRPMGTPIGTPMSVDVSELPALIGQENLRLAEAFKRGLGIRD